MFELIVANGLLGFCLVCCRQFQNLCSSQNVSCWTSGHLITFIKNPSSLQTITIIILYIDNYVIIIYEHGHVEQKYNLE